MGGETVRQVELEEGREHAGQNSWILRFRGINTVEQVMLILNYLNARKELSNALFSNMKLTDCKFATNRMS